MQNGIGVLGIAHETDDLADAIERGSCDDAGRDRLEVGMAVEVRESVAVLKGVNLQCGALAGGAARPRCRSLFGAGHKGGVHLLEHDRAVDDALAHVGATGQVVHHVQEDLFEDGPQPASAGTAQQRLLRDRLQRIRRELQLDAVELEELVVLLHQRVLRLDEDAHERFLVEVRHRADDGQPADELGDQPELEEILGKHLRQDRAEVLLLRAADVGAEADALAADAALDDLLDAGEGPAADEEDVGGVDLDELLVGMLAATLGRHRRRGALEDLQQGLLHALTGDVARDRRVLALAGDLVDLVDVDDPGLGLLDVVVGRLDELQENVLDVLAHVAGFGERRRVGNGKGHVEHAGQRLCQQRLAAARRTEQQDVRLRQLDVAVGVRADLHALVVVVDGDGEDLLRQLLPDDVVVQEVVDLAGLGKLVEADLRGLGELLLDDLVAEVDALVADVDAGTGDQLLDLLLRLPAEGTLEEVAPVSELRHRSPVAPSRVPSYATPAACGTAASSRVVRISSMMP